MGVVKVILNGDTKMDITPTTADANEVNQGEVFFNRSGEQSVGTGYPPSTRVPVYGMGKNLLDNWYFGNPVNQRGQSSYTGAVYGIDRWKGAVGYTIADVISEGYRVKSSNGSNTAITEQTLENPSQLLGKTVSLTILLSSGAYSYSATVPSSFTNTTIINGANVQLVMTSSGLIVVRLITNSSAGVVFVAVKLELGTEQTLCHNEGTAENPVWVLNEIPDYGEELLKCKTSTADSTDTYANKSLATEQQIAYVENGTTASRAYAVGEYFCLNGLLYRVKTAIGNGDTFIENTNCEQVAEGGLNRVWKDNYESTTFSSLVNCNSCSTPLAVYQTLMASSKAVGYGEIGNQQTSQLKSFLTNPYENYTTVTFEFISAGLIRCTARNTSDGSVLGKVCYLKGTINNLSSAWTVTDWEDVDGAIGHKEVTLTTSTLGTSFSPTARLIGVASTLFGVTADKILSIEMRDATFSPAAIMVASTYSGSLYLATTQNSTLSSSVKFLITYIK